MVWKEVVIVAAAVIAATATLVVPYLTYRFAVNQEHRKWLRERRLETYIDLISEMQLGHKTIESVLKGEQGPGELLDSLMSKEQLVRAQLFVSGNAWKLISPWLRASGDVCAAAAKAVRDELDDSDAEKALVEFHRATDEVVWHLVVMVRSELGSDGAPPPKRKLKRLRVAVRSDQ